MQRYLTWHHGMPSFPHHEHNEKGGSLRGLKVGHRCNVTSQGPMDGGDPSWCASWRKKHLKPKKKKGRLNKETTKRPLSALGKTSNVSDANP